MRKNNKRSSILDAAFKVVEEEGAGHLTLDAVAEKAAISKGGLLYHFATKQALLTGMLEYMVALNEARIAEHEAVSPDHNSLMAILSSRESMTPAEHRASQALLAAAAENQELLTPARDQYQAMFNTATAECKDASAAAVLLLASEGLRVLNILDVNPLNNEETAEIVDYMYRQAERL